LVDLNVAGYLPLSEISNDYGGMITTLIIIIIIAMMSQFSPLSIYLLAYLTAQSHL
jgi:hypothetical protein